jgi:hypothetical protein
MDHRRSLYPLCRHTKTDGLLCQSPALTGSAFCYYHRRLRHRRGCTPHPGLSRRYHVPITGRADFMQLLQAVLAGIASGDLRPSQAGRMLSLLQLASTQLGPKSR